jgi:hypothetical protein
MDEERKQDGLALGLVALLPLNVEIALELKKTEEGAVSLV